MSGMKVSSGPMYHLFPCKWVGERGGQHGRGWRQRQREGVGSVKAQGHAASEAHACGMPRQAHLPEATPENQHHFRCAPDLGAGQVQLPAGRAAAAAAAVPARLCGGGGAAGALPEVA